MEPPRHAWYLHRALTNLGWHEFPSSSIGDEFKKFLARIFPLDVVPFQSKEVGGFFDTWTTIQENGSSLLFDVMSVFHSHAKQAQTERDSFLFYRMPDSCIAFGCNNKNDLENGRALHRIPFF